MTHNFNDSRKNEDTLSSRDEDKLDTALRFALHRQDCPDMMELGEFQLGIMAESEVNRLKTHLKRCPHCQVELTNLANFLSEDAPVSSLLPVDEDPSWIQGRGFKWQQLQKTGRVIIQVMGDALNKSVSRLQQGLQTPPDRLAYGGLRSKEVQQPLFKLTLTEGIEDLEVDITAEVKRDEPDHCILTVEVKIPSLGGWPNLAGTEVLLEKDELILATQITDAFGRTVFERVAVDLATQLSFNIVPANIKREI